MRQQGKTSYAETTGKQQRKGEGEDEGRVEEETLTRHREKPGTVKVSGSKQKRITPLFDRIDASTPSCGVPLLLPFVGCW